MCQPPYIVTYSMKKKIVVPRNEETNMGDAFSNKWRDILGEAFQDIPKTSPKQTLEHIGVPFVRTNMPYTMNMKQVADAE